ncbi:uncharacterized protein Dwil_GK20719 [Drosophila willistoni]|uniref:Uncharacterized protein n=1 Tax=Drosophila willistoni TaxID=7260 RepID=B4MX63_DROWI|nr:uncharacterized protein Dwil_GK20719 [Drosophila willistoni]
MSRILLLLALCSVCFLAVEAQGGGRQLCERQNRICQSNERRLGRRDDVTDAFNARCRRDNSRWRNISRCELARASCQCKILTN